LIVDTLIPRAINRGISLVMSVVLPEPLHPASPIMRIIFVDVFMLFS